MATVYPEADMLMNPDRREEEGMRDGRVERLLVEEGTKEVMGFKPAKASVVGKRENEARASTAATVEQLNLMFVSKRQFWIFSRVCM
jgi:hypothetical protein